MRGRPQIEPIAYLNGHRISAAAPEVPATDAGFMLGAVVAEQLRTFAGEIYELEAHLDRLFGGLKIVGWQDQVDREQLAREAREVVEHNRSVQTASPELGLTLFVTPGTYSIYQPPGAEAPPATVGVHSYPLPIWLWSDLYRNGERLVVTPYRQVTPQHWPTALKCRSRMHYYLADRAARQVDPGARALMLDLAGRVAETSIANIVGYSRQEGLVTPPEEVALPGITLRQLHRLADQLGLPFQQRTLELEELTGMDEVWLTSTPYCLVAVVSIEGRAIGDGRPGPQFHRLLDAWSGQVGVDLLQQARQFIDV